MKFNYEDWPHDGTDWDGIHDDVMRRILQNKEDAEKWNRLVLPKGFKPNPYEIVERLKNRIEEYKVNEALVQAVNNKRKTMGFTEFFISELEEILEGKE